jgi:hypothetical protein
MEAESKENGDFFGKRPWPEFFGRSGACSFANFASSDLLVTQVGVCQKRGKGGTIVLSSA